MSLPINTLKVFISGNRSISQVSDKVSNLISDIINIELEKNPSGYNEVILLVGDADGVDSLVQNSCSDTEYVVVYHSGKEPRNLNKSVSETKRIPAYGTGREYHTYKDQAMGRDCTIHIGLVSTYNTQWLRSGTRANHNYVTSLGKPSFLISVTTGETIVI